MTTGHEGNATERANNSVNIDGKINAGIHNSLKMEISGGKLSANESENPSVDVTEGADIFDPSTINFNATATMTNPFLADYNKALSDLQAYTPGSAEYNSLSNQVVGMEKVMATYGFAEKISGTDQYIVYDKIQIPAMELPKIELAGGRVYVNDVTTTRSGNLKLNTQSDYTPAITVNNTGDAFKIVSDGRQHFYQSSRHNPERREENHQLGGQCHAVQQKRLRPAEWRNLFVDGDESKHAQRRHDNKQHGRLAKRRLRPDVQIHLRQSKIRRLVARGYGYAITMQHDKYTLAKRREILSDVAGTSSWYKGNNTTPPRPNRAAQSYRTAQFTSRRKI